ncbi:LPP20 family lipoprotein [Candidatus Sulfurimonas marisnigri]|uniref:LPP20 family lipoprotein n=1 Tax=Candidatus Sulfurimonas marisnigri TaxID=2740405 RepID=A0A7S7M2H6_9BACT|nr:LPP20 family lipoprotein [Candidatus Sulfurimonas marisnigri]QOY55338.1 LPP20 family lipoprotein [Candidatus Sulfurimonas marisnigri]
MKFSILLALLLSVSSLFGADKIQSVDTSVMEQTNAELAKAKKETARAKADLAKVNLEREQEALYAAEAEEREAVLNKNQTIHISVTGQGVAPMNTVSPAQAYALAKRAAIADAYRAIAEKVKGVRIDGQDLIKNMMVKRSVIRTSVNAMIRNANVVETTFKEGLCEVEMEIVISHSDFAQ